MVQYCSIALLALGPFTSRIGRRFYPGRLSPMHRGRTRPRARRKGSIPGSDLSKEGTAPLKPLHRCPFSLIWLKQEGDSWFTRWFNQPGPSIFSERTPFEPLVSQVDDATARRFVVKVLHKSANCGDHAELPLPEERASRERVLSHGEAKPQVGGSNFFQREGGGCPATGIGVTPNPAEQIQIYAR